MDPQLESIPLTFFPHLSMSIDEQYAIMVKLIILNVHVNSIQLFVMLFRALHV